MIQNIKVDTIYYLTNSDFEMEFNLCGCCKMRLLTDKAENAKNFVGLLSRAVSRSQVIICCGKLFSNDGLINIISKAIKKPLVAVDNTAYGIADSNEIEIMEGAVPLVNADGCFCGCIAESGPQSIILLTDNKGLRKTVLKQLIHPYIEELSIIRNTKEPSVLPQTDSNELAPEPACDELPLQENSEEAAALTEGEVSPEMLEALQNNGDTENDASEAETTTDMPNNTPDSCAEAVNKPDALEEAADEITDKDVKELNNIQENTSLEIKQDDENSSNKDQTKTNDFTLPEVIIDEAPETAESAFIDPAEINSGFELYLEPERVKYSKKSHYALNYIPSEQDKEFISESSDLEFFEEEHKSTFNLPILIVVIILLIALAALAYLLVFIPMRSDYVFSEYIKNIFSVSVSFKTLL